MAGAFSGGVIGLLTSSYFSVFLLFFLFFYEVPQNVTHEVLLHSIGGRANALPGAIMFSIFGLVGQSIYNFADARHSEMQRADFEASGKQSTWKNLLNSRWSPVKELSDKEYEQMLEEKLLRLNAEIALIDEDISKLRGEGKQSRPTDRSD